MDKLAICQLANHPASHIVVMGSEAPGGGERQREVLVKQTTREGEEGRGRLRQTVFRDSTVIGESEKSYYVKSLSPPGQGR